MYFLFRFGWHSFQLNVVNYKQGLGGGGGGGGGGVVMECGGVLEG